MKKADTAANVSLVAFYGDKPIELINLIKRLQRKLDDDKLLEDKFIPYQIEQVHATIIGCEGLRNSQGIISQWLFERRGEEKYINFADLTNYLQQLDLSLTIRFGGYDRDRDYNFLSRDRSLYDRSFQLLPADDLTIPVLIGWSWQNNSVTLAIDKLRRSFQQFNLLHKYHATTEAIDNDFYLRLGTINAQLSVEEIKAIALEICELLAVSAVSIPLVSKDLAFVRYQDLQLTPSTTKVVPISDITASQLEQLYPN